MIPTPSEVLAAITAVANAAAAAFTWMQTAEGRKVVNRALEDRAAWDAFWRRAGDAFIRFMKGEYFR
ncbi:MAG TPA: hypothetical protein VFQ79_24625 [Bryobacteraceae bacterium]|nr:hypothetical protein [Bryobacteraceae bacterium]